MILLLFLSFVILVTFLFFSFFFNFLTLYAKTNLTGDGRIIRFSWAGNSGLERQIFALRENLTEQPVLSKATSLLGKFLGMDAVDRL